MAGTLSYQGQQLEQQGQQLENTAVNQGNTLFGQGQTAQNALTPYYQQQMNNPQGLGATTIQQMLTRSGQGIAGAEGAARQTGTDLAARTGNTSAIPSIVGSANKAGMIQQSNAGNNIAIQNAMQKLQQQQQGAAGMNSLFNTDTKSALEAGQNATGDLNAAIKGKQVQDQEAQSIFKDFAGGAMMAAAPFAGPLAPGLLAAGGLTMGSGQG